MSSSARWPLQQPCQTLLRHLARAALVGSLAGAFEHDKRVRCDERRGGRRRQDRIERALHSRHISSRNVVRRFVTIALQHISQTRSPKSWTMVTECSRTCLVVTTPAIMSRLLGVDLAAVVPDS
jgi:hypothetical protein